MSNLSCQDVVKSFREVVALDGVTVVFPSQRITALVGPNGSGKTTLLNVVCGHTRADAGRVHFGGLDITGLPPFRIARLGLARIFQENRLALEMSAIQNVLLGYKSEQSVHLLHTIAGALPGMRGEQPLEEAAEYLRLVRLDDVADTVAGALSYGQQKLLSIACCLSQGASTLLLDEPLAGVHPELSSVIRETIVGLARNGRTIVFVEHDMAVVRELAHQVVVLHEGKVLAVGCPDDVLSRSEVVEAYVGRSNNSPA